MKYLVLLIVLGVFLTSCAVKQKAHNYDQETFEKPFNTITTGTSRETVLSLTKKPYKILIGVKDQDRLVDIYYFKLDKKGANFKIIFYQNKVMNVFRFDDSISMKSR